MNKLILFKNDRPFSSSGQFLFLLLFGTFVGSGYGMLRAFGDSCEEGEPCLGDHVVCLASGFCGCSSSEYMTYDPDAEACRVNLGKSCGKNEDCIQGAWCDAAVALCRCDNGSYPSPTGSCLPKKSHNEPCTNDGECGLGRSKAKDQPQRPLICLNSHCQCNKKTGDVYDESQRACVGLVDSECDIIGQDDCTENAHCTVTSGSPGKAVCQCDVGYAKTTQGTCGRTYGAHCGRGSQNSCADIHFICIEGKCRCKYPLHQVYDERQAECLSLVSGPCTFPGNGQKNLTGFSLGDIQKCVKNAQCVDKGFYSECECKPGFVYTKSGACTPGFQEPCEPGDCDPDGISFLNGFCDCLDLLQVYDTSIKKCRGLIGSRCTLQKPECVEFASCVVPNPRLPGKCLCDKYSQEVVNRTCDYHV